MRKGFTLAEVLITIAIVGIVATFTIPTLLNKIERTRNANTLKNAYSHLKHYLDMFNYEYDCDNNLYSCTPESHEFLKKFSKYLVEKQGFTNQVTINGYQWFNVKKNSTEFMNFNPAFGNSKFDSGYGFYLIAPGGHYAYFVTNYPYDMYYTVKGIPNDYFRARVFIVTDTNHSKGFCKNICSQTERNSTRRQMTRNVFLTHITNFKNIIPDGSPLCTGWQYYCASSACTNCMQNIIDAGWKIEYDY